jgi:CHRD domain/Domain of unknown function (DUF4214)
MRSWLAPLVAVLFIGIASAQPIVYNVVLEGYQVSPYVSTPATGGGTATYDPVAHTLTLNIVYAGLTGTEIEAHLSDGGGPRGSNGVPYFDLSAGSPKTGVLVLQDFEEVHLLQGRLYIIVQTTTYPNGELRGQIDNLGAAPLRTLAVTTAATVTVTASTEAGNVINCAPQTQGHCSELIPLGKAVALGASTISPGAFAFFGGDCTNLGNPCQLSMNADKAVTGELASGPDMQPDPFTFTDASNVTPGTVVTSNPITVTGISNVTSIGVAGGAYSIGCNGTFITAQSTVAVGNTVCVRHTAAATFGTTYRTLLTIGGIAAAFNSTTATSLPDTDGDGIPDAIEPLDGRDPYVKDNDVFGDPRLFVKQLYRDMLGREGEGTGVDGWLNLINSGSYSRSQVIDSFIYSQEFAASVSNVVRMYFAAFQRLPDYAGLVFNAGLVRSGAITIPQLADYFVASPEFQSTYGALDDTQFITLLYQNTFGRAPSPSELSSYLGNLHGGNTRGDVLYTLANSGEFPSQSQNEIFVTMMYVGMLRRSPEPAGYDGWMNYLTTGTLTHGQVIDGFYLSTEYRSRFLP